MFKKGLISIFLAVSLVMLTGGISEASVAKKQIPVNYNDIKLNVNGATINVLPLQEPFMFNGTTFVPLRLVAESLNFNVVWQGETNSVVITTKTSPEITNLKSLLVQKDLEIQNLKNQIEDLLNKLEKEETDLRDLEDTLIDDYDALEDVSVDSIALDGDEESVDVEIEVDLDKYDNEWEDLSDREIEDWLEELVEDIQDELSEDTEVNGEIINSDNDDVVVKFYKDGEDDLEIDFEDEDYREKNDSDVAQVIDDLEGDSYYIDDIEFYVADISYSESRDEVIIELEAEYSDTADLWDDISNSIRDSDIKSIGEEIVDIFDDEADVNVETVVLYFYDDDYDLLDSFEYDANSGTMD